MKFLNFMTFQVFHDPHEPIQTCYTDCGFRPSKTQLGDGVGKVSFFSTGKDMRYAKRVLCVSFTQTAVYLFFIIIIFFLSASPDPFM